MQPVMRLLDAGQMALRQLRSQRLKSACMMAGIAVAVGFLMALVSILAGTRARMEASFARYASATTFRITSHREVHSYAEAMAQRTEHTPPLTEADAEAIGAALPSDAHWATARSGSVTVASRLVAQPRSAYAEAVSGAYFDIDRRELGRGRLPTPQEIALGVRVAVLWSVAASTEYPGVDPIGRPILVSGVPYTVVGVLAPNDDERYRREGRDPVLGVIIPLHSPAARAFSAGQAMQHEVYVIRVQVARSTDVAAGEARAREVLRVRHRLGPQAKDDFGISSGREYLDLMEKESRQFMIAGIMLPSIGLIVGALVIANIMLVAVAERTREIGIRKAIGARRADVLLQFLLEATTLSVLGAIVGIVCGLAVPAAVSQANPDFPAAVAPWSIVLALFLGLTVGVASGVYPAMRAARLDPIRALRDET